MRALLCHEHGDYRDLKIEEIDPPEPGPGEVLIDVRAAGISFAGILAIAGKHQNKTEPPFVPGREAAGIVISCGDGVDHLAPGDRVYASVPSGAFAEQAIAKADLTYPMPSSLNFAEATWLPTNYAVAYGAIAIEGQFEAGESLLVHGAAGASGYAAVEVGKALGGTVIATTSSEEKAKVARAAGADHTLPSDTFRDAVLELTGGRGVDVIYDPVGGDAFDQSLRSIAPEGRMLTIGFASGRIPTVPANILLVKNISVIGVNWGYYTGWSHKHPAARGIKRRDRTYAALSELCDQGLLKPRVHQTLPLEDFVEGFQTVEERKVIGKVVLDPTLT